MIEAKELSDKDTPEKLFVVSITGSVILYEYPFNERIRTYLRLEHLFRKLNQLIARDDALDHHYAPVHHL